MLLCKLVHTELSFGYKISVVHFMYFLKPLSEYEADSQKLERKELQRFAVHEITTTVAIRFHRIHI